MPENQLVIMVKPEHDSRMKVVVPWQRKDWIQQIRRLPNRAWNQQEKYWSVPKDAATLSQLKDWFGDCLHVEDVLEINIGGGSISKKVTNNTAGLKSESSVNTDLLKLPKDLSFKTIKQKDYTYKVFVGQKVVIRKVDDKWLQVWVPYYKKGWIDTVKNIIGRKWQSDKKCWVIPNVKDSYRCLKQHIGMKNLDFRFQIVANIPECYVLTTKKALPRKKSLWEQLTDHQQTAIQQTVERLILERLSYSTQKTYKHHLAGLFYFYPKVLPKEISKEQVEQYLLHRIKYKKIAESTQNQIINAVKAYWEKVLKRDKAWLNIQRPKKPKQLPNVLSKVEIIQLLDVVVNLKHKLILLLIYSAGLRLGEVVNLLCRDLNVNRRHIHIKGGKGKKDRYVALAETVLPFLADYKKQYRPSYWLFEGQDGGQYSKRSVQHIFKRVVQKAKVNPYATVHTLRHSYATHCVEDGHNLKAVQDALGHASPETTQIYLHLSTNTLKQLKSPIDSLKIEKK